MKNSNFDICITRGMYSFLKRMLSLKDSEVSNSHISISHLIITYRLDRKDNFKRDKSHLLFISKS